MTCSNSLNTTDIGNLDGCISLCPCSIPKLTIPVVTPSPDNPILFKCHCVHIAYGNSINIVEAGNLDRSVFAYRRSITKLTVYIPSPSPDGPILFKCYCVTITTCGNSFSIVEASNLNWYISVCCRAITQLTIIIPSPSPDSPIFFKCHSVITASSTSDSPQIVKSGNLNW